MSNEHGRITTTQVLMTMSETDHHHLATTNAPRRCGGCGAAATVYDHAVGFRCSDCGDYPDGRRQGGQGDD